MSSKKINLTEEDLLLQSLMREISATEELSPNVSGYFAQKIKIIRDKLKEKETTANNLTEHNSGEDKSFSLKKPAPQSLASSKKKEYYF